MFISTAYTDFLRSLTTGLLLCLLYSACAQADTSWETRSSRYLEKLLASNLEHLQELEQPAIVDFYRERGYTPLWMDSEGWLNRAYELLHVISHAYDEGLEPSNYHAEEIRQYWNSTVPGDHTHVELLLSAALYRYSHDVHSGRSDPHDMDADWHLHGDPVDDKRLFSDVADDNSIMHILEQLPPQHAGYQFLKKQLQRFRRLAQLGGWKTLEPGVVLELGVQHKQVVQLRQRLLLTGDLVTDSLPGLDIYDRGLEKAVMHYQSRHGLKADGRVGAQTRKSLNVPIQERIRQIRINMERWRWLPRWLGKKYVVVNMAGFELYIVENGSEILSMPVIIGKNYRSTPSFSGRISYMEYNPYWTIPMRLVREDFLPRQINDPDYLPSRSIRVFQGWTNPREIDSSTIDWSRVDKDTFSYWLRQDPGPGNALGRIKFIFSNPYEVYLHGTPDKHLFDRVVRNFSSGCIRVKDPVRLAAYLLNDGSQQMEEEILANIHLDTNQRVSLPVAVSIYLVYMTAWANQDGNINFLNDIYHRDTRLNQLFGQ